MVIRKVTQGLGLVQGQLRSGVRAVRFGCWARRRDQSVGNLSSLMSEIISSSDLHVGSFVGRTCCLESHSAL